MEKIFLIDAYALIYRSYYALLNSNFYSTQMQMNTGTIHGFMNTLQEVLSKEKPTHVGVAFDHGKTFRHEAYPPYKAQRQETPEDIKAAVPVIKDLLTAMNIPILQIDGFEADDIIGALATQLDKENTDETAEKQIFMLTPDKDYGQLVTENVFMYKPRFKGDMMFSERKKYVRNIPFHRQNRSSTSSPSWVTPPTSFPWMPGCG